MEESIAEYVAELRRLATDCEFGDYLGEALRDRLVCGTRSSSVQKRLLSEADLTFKRALEIAQAMEAAESNVKSGYRGINKETLHQFTEGREESIVSARAMFPLWSDEP